MSRSMSRIHRAGLGECRSCTAVPSYPYVYEISAAQIFFWKRIKKQSLAIPMRLNISVSLLPSWDIANRGTQNRPPNRRHSSSRTWPCDHQTTQIWIRWTVLFGELREMAYRCRSFKSAQKLKSAITVLQQLSQAFLDWSISETPWKRSIV